MMRWKTAGTFCTGLSTTRSEVAADIDIPGLTETLLVLLCGVGFYAGYVQRPHDEMETVTAMLRQLLAGALWRPTT